jgi:hypothetical protein
MWQTQSQSSSSDSLDVTSWLSDVAELSSNTPALAWSLILKYFSLWRK